MDRAHLLQVIEIYRRKLEELNIPKLDFPHDKHSPKPNHVIEHAHDMLDMMVGFVEEGRLDKANRWLGFVQCALWSTGVYTLNELKDHNRSPQNT
jgi:hypothetical protein